MESLIHLLFVYIYRLDHQMCNLNIWQTSDRFE